MRPIDKFILHVVHNLFPLNEYSDKEVKFLMDKFKEEAEDLNIQVSDAQLKKYIERFDALKNSPKVTDKDLRKYSLSKLIKLITSSPGAEISSDEEEEDNTPDVVYNDNGITIWNGAKQGNCITYGASQKLPGGSKWCITEPGGSYFGRYRYGADYDYPTFYLAKNSNLPDSDVLSFVSLQVLKGGDYKFTNRANSPGMEGPFSWEELNRRVPWLKDIPNLKNILKYIPFSKSEKESEVFKRNPISIKQWIKEPFSIKKQYLIVRSGNRQLFSDISNDLFISKYLPQYPQIATTIAGTAGIIDLNDLIKYLDKFSKQDQLSIAKQIRNKFNLSIFDQDIPFDLKKYLVKTDKINLTPEQRLYVTKDNQAIILLTLGDNIKIGLYTEDDEYPNIRLNKRTAKYLLDYPELDKIPLRNLLKLVEDEIIDKDFITRILNNAKENPNSAIVVKPVEGGEIILDSNSFSSYKIDDSGKISAVPFNNEEVQQVFNDAKDNESFQQNALNLFKTNDDISPTIDKGALKNIINSIPSNKRVIQLRGEQPTVVLTADGPIPFFTMWANPMNPTSYIIPVSKYNEEGRVGLGGSTSNEMMTSYFNYLRQINKSFNDNDLLGILRSSANGESKRKFARNNPPVDANNRYRVVAREDDVYVVNTQNPRESFMLSTSRNNLKQASISSPLAAQLLGRQPQQAPGQAVAQANDAVRAARRGRPAGVPNAPRPQQAQPAVPAGQGVRLTNIANTLNLTGGFNILPRLVLRKFNMDGRQLPTTNDRGASRRNNILGNSGRVTAVYEFGPSSVYIIQLANNTRVASIVAQPGNSHFIVTNNNAIELGSPAGLLQALQLRNLAEIHRYIVNEYFDRNPKHITEFKQLLRKHINEKKMDKSKLKEIIRGIVDKVLAERAYSPYEEEEDVETLPTTKPYNPYEDDEDNDDLNIGNPNVDPNPKASEKETLRQIVARFKSKN
jgi:hypothetical protein